MSFICTLDKDPIKLKLKRDRTRNIKQGFPWIYADCFVELPPAPAGTRAMVKDRDGSLLAFGMYDPNSPLAVRVIAVEEERLDDALIEQRLERALALRRRLFGHDTNGFRLLNGEGDGLPGLVCDVYANHAVIRLDGAGPTAFWNLQSIAEWLTRRAGVSVVYFKPRSDENSEGRVLIGTIRSPEVEFLENGARFKADIVRGQKSGFFLDQRDNRARFGALARDRSVLNICGYTGGFSIYAGRGGARDVTTVDIAKPAIAAAEANWALNDLPVARHQGVAADAFDFFADARKTERRWDLIVVDPPSFAPAERHVPKARESYQALFTAALQSAAQYGVVALSSCSSHIPSAMFMEICESAVSKARRRASVLGMYGQPEDHPFPLACSELQYLKFVLLQLR